MKISDILQRRLKSTFENNAKTLEIHENDNVYINLEEGHKYARRDIKKGENIIKYGFPIGHATEDIK